MRSLWAFLGAMGRDPDAASTPQRVVGTVLLMCLFVLAAASIR